MIGGETGIRTLGRLPFNGFQDRRIRPLCHLSVTDFIITQGCLQLIFMVYCEIIIGAVDKNRGTFYKCLLYWVDASFEVIFL